MTAQVKLDEILNDKMYEIRQAMTDVLQEFAPQLVSDADQITREFIRRVDYHTLIWTRVPDRYVEVKK